MSIRIGSARHDENGKLSKKSLEFLISNGGIAILPNMGFALMDTSTTTLISSL